MLGVVVVYAFSLNTLKDNLSSGDNLEDYLQDNLCIVYKLLGLLVQAYY